MPWSLELARSTRAFSPRYSTTKNKVGIGVALTGNVTGVLDKWFDEHQVGEGCRTIMEGYRENTYRAPPGYPARPLDGYWATGPFLHNGSVRTMYQLLSPVEKREESFWIGSREFDPVHLGFVSEKVQGAFLFDTSLGGNTNAGHEFRNAPPNTAGVIGPHLTPEQRLDLIEYLKVIDDFQTASRELKTRYAVLDALAPYYESYSATSPYGEPAGEGSWTMEEFCKAIEEAVAASAAQEEQSSADE